MRIEALIAARYLFAGRQKSVVNIISWVSLAGLMVSTAALIVVLSVYNGIGELTKGLFSTFDPELVVEPAEGKTFRTEGAWYAALLADDDVEAVSQMVSETAWITYADNQAIVELRGVDERYHEISGLDTLLNEGQYVLRMDGTEVYTLLAGGEIYYELGLRVLSNVPAAVHIPKRGKGSFGFSMDEAFRTGYAYPAGYFFIQQDIDRKYVVAHVDFVRRLMDYAPDECTALGLKLRPGCRAGQVKKRLQQAVAGAGTPLVVKDRYDQQPLYFKIFRSERLGIFLILSLIVLISTLSLVASLSLLVINKQRDVFILQGMGMTERQLKRAFVLEGLMICAVAVAAGLVLGAMVCLLQQWLGIIRMGDGNFVVDAFPVAMRGADFLATLVLVMAIGAAAVCLTVRHARLEPTKEA